MSNKHSKSTKRLQRILVQGVLFRLGNRGIEILLSKRLNEPYKNSMQGFGGKGHVFRGYYDDEINEDVFVTLIREAEEETNMKLMKNKCKKIWSKTTPSKKEWFDDHCSEDEALYDVTLTLFMYPYDGTQDATMFDFAI
ncbi:5364_t:CDS:2 [Dentiscutata erythropus]|uniref:5364_t:CDS:1 n=1 Tax=Dentiscutata erythropus TaxID=1348616 RepID=A0A9N9NHT2_9GLOM|nr:5364_t:CDS:2 [Dentiscutata erythropus]